MSIHRNTFRGLEVQRDILERFRAIGWDIDSIVPVATRSYETIVGLKEASVWVQPEIWPGMAPGNQRPLCALRPCYETEGRNILEASGMPITQGMTEQDVWNAFDALVESVEMQISRHWTRRLFLES